MHMAFLSRGFKNLQWYAMTEDTCFLKQVFSFFGRRNAGFAGKPKCPRPPPKRSGVTGRTSRRPLDRGKKICYDMTERTNPVKSLDV